jgi:hypothetical protein
MGTLEEVSKQVNGAVASRLKKKGFVEYVEVTEEQWGVLMTYPDFKKQADMGNANFGGYKVKKGKRLRAYS